MDSVFTVRPPGYNDVKRVDARVANQAVDTARRQGYEAGHAVGRREARIESYWRGYLHGAALVFALWLAASIVFVVFAWPMLRDLAHQ